MVIVRDESDYDDCYTCKALSKQKPLFVANYAETKNGIGYQIEYLMEYCPRCGKKLISREDAINESREARKNDVRIAQISSEIATDEVIEIISKELNRIKGGI